MAKINNLKSLKKYQIIKFIRNYEKRIKSKCYDCMAGQKKIDCRLEECSLYSFRPWAKNEK